MTQGVHVGPFGNLGERPQLSGPVVSVGGGSCDGRPTRALSKVMCFFEVGDGKGTLLQFD